MTGTGPQRLRRRVAAAFAVVGLAALAVPIAGQPAAAAGDSTLTIGIAEHGATLNPFLANLDPDLDAIASVYPSLTRYNSRSEFTPYLADKWSTSGDKLTWTFRIHKGLKWSDGKALTAKDIAWTFNLILTNEVAATANGLLLSNFKSVTAPDANTLVITTKKPQSNLLYVSYIPIVPQHVWESRVKNLNNVKNTDAPLVGYGPWKFSTYKTDQYIALKANKDFFLGRPKYDKLVLQTYQNIDAAVNGLRSGQVDQVDKLTATEYRALSKQKGITAYQQVASRWTGVEINANARAKSGKKLGSGNPILGDTTVRQAIAYGIDRSTLVKKVLNGLGEPGSGYLPPAFPEFAWKPSAANTVGYSPDKANALLEGAGYKRGSGGVRRDPKSGKPLEFRLGIHSDDTNDTAISGYLVSWMKAIGITLKVQSQSNAALNANLAKGDWDLLMDGWGMTVDPTYLLGIQTCGVLPNDKAAGGQTDAFFCDKAYDQLQSAQQQEFNADRRAGIVAKMQQILYKANYDIVLYNQSALSAIRTEAKDGFISGKPNAKGFYPFQNYKLGWEKAAPPKADSASSSNSGLIIGIIVAVVVVAGLVVFVGLRRRAGAADRE